MADRYIKPTGSFSSNSIGKITPEQISSIFDSSASSIVTTTAFVPWTISFTYNCVLTFPANTWISRFYMSTGNDYTINVNNKGTRPRTGTSTIWSGLFSYTISYFDINDFVSTISFGAKVVGTGGNYNIYFLLAQGNGDSGLRVRGRDNKVYWIGTDPNSDIKIRNKNNEIVSLDYGSTRASPCRIRRKNGSVDALRYIKIV